MSENIELNVLGCGSSFGVPLSHNIWGNCDKTNIKNYRTRPSILLKKAGKSILIDTSPDLRRQLIENKIDNIDSVIYTHSHADHIHGINDLRAISLINRKKIPIYSDEITLNIIKNSFSYLFFKDSNHGYEPILLANTLNSKFIELNGFKIEIVHQNHGNIDSYGFIFDNKIAYNLDVKFFYDENYLNKINGIKCWFIGCLRYDDHPSHASYEEVIDWTKKVNAKQTFLSHMTAHIDYETEYNKLCSSRVFPAYDGLKLTI
ncbi:MBL fold metallo-hydrolase [Alphaproteobacteria bacterium]|nr:MBL fold metallo-hydrolase [Alphaproteobacteria bacterium]